MPWERLDLGRIALGMSLIMVFMMISFLRILAMTPEEACTELGSIAEELQTRAHPVM